jgi:hypothetical protein
MTLGRYPREPLATDGELLAKNPAGQPRADALVERLPSVISVNRSRGKFWTWVMEAFRHSGIVTQRPSVCPPQNGALNSVLDSVEQGANTSCDDAFAEHAWLSQSFAMRFSKGEGRDGQSSNDEVGRSKPRASGASDAHAVGSKGASSQGMVAAGEGAGGAHCEPSREQHS